MLVSNSVNPHTMYLWINHPLHACRHITYERLSSVHWKLHNITYCTLEAAQHCIVQICVLQEGFGLSSSPVLPGQGARLQCGLIQSMWLWMRLCLNRRYGMGPACDSLDYRARAFYLPYSLHTMNFIMLLACAHSWFPPPHFERILHLVNQGFHHSGARIDVLCSLINSCAGPKTQRLKIVGS